MLGVHVYAAMIKDREWECGVDSKWAKTKSGQGGGEEKCGESKGSTDGKRG